MLNLIVAISENRVIGEKGRIPWYLPEDLQRFKSITNNHPIIMGRKTHESIGRVLPRRTNIVITRDRNYSSQGCRIVHSLEEAIQVAQSENPNEIFIIGGGQVFEEAMPIADKLYLTIVHTSIEGDAFFPDYSRFKKVVKREEQHNEKLRYTFLELTP